MITTSFPGFSLLLRERNLVPAGHVEMCVNKLRSRGKSSTKFCRLDDGIPSGLGKNSCFKLAIEFLRSLQTALLSACSDEIILKAKQVICLGNLYLKKTCSSFCQQDTQIYLDLQVQNQLFVNLHTTHPPGRGLRV